MKQICGVLLGILFLGSVIHAQNMTMTSPNGGENWKSDALQNVTWTFAGIPDGTLVKLVLFKDGVKVGNIVENIAIGSGGTGSYSWKVGGYAGGIAATGNGYKIRIRDMNGQYPLDESDGPFAITAATQPTTMKINSPHDADNWTQGAQQNISWTWNGPAIAVKLILLKDGNEAGIIYQDWLVSANSYSWKVGSLYIGNAESGSGYKIRMQDINNHSQFADSDGTFTIANSPLEVISKEFPEGVGKLFPFKPPHLVVTLIDLLPNTEGFGVIFGYKNTGEGPLPPRHELQVQPKYRVFADGKEIAEGTLLVPDQPAPPGFEVKTHFGGWINFPPKTDLNTWTVNQIHVYINTNRILGMPQEEKSEPFKPFALKYGYDFRIVSISMDWNARKATYIIARDGPKIPQGCSPYVRWIVEGSADPSGANPQSKFGDQPLILDNLQNHAYHLDLNALHLGGMKHLKIAINIITWGICGDEIDTINNFETKAFDR